MALWVRRPISEYQGSSRASASQPVSHEWASWEMEDDGSCTWVHLGDPGRVPGPWLSQARNEEWF